jgi:ammonia channel protein AmtB
VHCEAETPRETTEKNAVGAAFSFAGSYLLPKVVDFITPVKVAAEEEEVGLDQSQHGEKAHT